MRTLPSQARASSRETTSWFVTHWQRDDVLELGYAKDGARAYVCVEGGGVDVPVVLGSRSTDLRAGLGGFEGRALAPGDSVGRVSGGPPTLDRVRSVHDPLRTGSSTATTSKTW